MKRFWDPFRGNVRNPGEFVFFYILINLIVISCLVMIASNADPVTVSDLQYSDVIFENCTPNPDDESDLDLSVSGEQMYYEIISYENTLISPELFMESYRKNESFQIGFTTVEKADPPYRILYEINGNDDTVHLTLDTMNAYHTSVTHELYAIFGSLAVIWNIIIILSIIIGRHPEWFTPRFARLFFKPGYIKRSARKQKRS